MRPFEISFILISILLLFLVCFFGKRRTWLARCFLLGLSVLILHLIFEAARWQMLPCYLTFAVSALMIFRHRTAHLLLRVPGFILGLLLVSTSAFYAVTMPIKELPVPSGRYQVGTTNFTLVDHSRMEMLSENPYDKRELFVEVWYPANINGLRDLPRPRSLWRELYLGNTDLVKFFMSYLNEVGTNSYPDVPPEINNGPFPLLLFNHGLQMFTAQNTILMEHLASHGYIIASIGHPYESLRVNLPGSDAVIPQFLSSMDNFQQGLEWIKESSIPILAARDSIGNVQDPRQRANIMLRAIDGSEMNDLVSVWEADSRFVLDELLVSNHGQFVFQNAIDPGRIGAMGMSVGGATATEICKSDRRVKAGINIDGLQYGNHNHVGLKVPFMMVYSMDGAGNNEFLRLDSQNDFHQYTFLGARHADFTDMPYIWPVMRIYGQLGQIPAEKMIQLPNNIILNFWDHYLKNQPLETYSSEDYPELEILIMHRDQS